MTARREHFRASLVRILVGVLLISGLSMVGSSTNAAATTHEPVPPQPISTAEAPPVPLSREVIAQVAAEPTTLVVGFDTALGAAAIRQAADSGPGPANLRAGVARASEIFAHQKRSVRAGAGSGIKVVREFDSLPVQLVQVESTAALSALSTARGVTSVSLPKTYRSTADDDLTLIQQPEAQAAGFTGAGVTIAVIDTGTDYLRAGVGNTFGDCTGGPGTGTCRIDHYTDVTGTGLRDADPGGHGTNVSGIVAKTAPGAHLDVYGVFDSTGTGATDGDVLAALNAITRDGPGRGVRAVNLSLGDGELNTVECTTSIYSSTFTNLRSVGILPIVAAGNAAIVNGTPQPGVASPACATGAIRVGAVYPADYESIEWGSAPNSCIDSNPPTDRIACFSQYGPLVSLLAPGVDIAAAGIAASGTSQAAPHVAGAVADVLSANPQATTQQVAQALVGTGRAITDPRDGTRLNRLDIAAAVASVRAKGAFTPLAPSRILDTRTNTGATGPVPALGSVSVQVTGKGGVPAAGVSAVALNVTAVSPSGAGYITAWPSGTNRPAASNLNFSAGQNIPNLVIVPVGANGTIQLFNGSTGTVQLLADVAGYYLAGAPTLPGTFGSLAPSRILDTRTNTGATGPVPALGSISVQVNGRGGVPATGVAAVALNVTAVSPSTAGYITAWPSGTARPNASNLNFHAGADIPNLVIVPVGADGKIQLFNGSPGTVQLLADVAGYYRGGTPAAIGAFTSLTPNRILDTRSNTGASGPVAALGTISIQVTGKGGIPTTGVSAVAFNVTAVSPTAAGYITGWPSGSNRPNASNLNFDAGRDIPNLVIVPVGADGKIQLFNGSPGTVQLLADVAGYYRSG